jgi:cellulose synthase (UDP-forming)
LQAFFIDSNPLTIKGLNFIQRLAHLEGLLNWFDSLRRVFFLAMPLVYSFLGVIPFRSSGRELLYFFLPYYLVQMTVFSWLNRRSRSALLSDIYSFVLCIPLAFTVIKVMFNPFDRGFKVTPKGISSNRFSFNWSLGLPSLILFVATAISLLINLTTPFNNQLSESGLQTMNLGWIWSSYNLIMLGIGLFILIDVPKPDIYDWFQLQRVIKLKIGNQLFWGTTNLISEVGAEISLTQPFSSVNGETLDYASVELEMMEDNLQFSGQIVRTGFNGDFPTVRIAFDSLSIDQHRRLVEMLFCRPGQWKRHETPGELQSIWLLFKILFKPRFIFDRKREVKAMAIYQV